MSNCSNENNAIAALLHGATLRPRRMISLVLFTTVFLFFMYCMLYNDFLPLGRISNSQENSPFVRRDEHPISVLIEKATIEHQKILDKQTSTLSGAAAAYRKRRGRHPPPQFTAWFNYAKARNVVIVEDFWDLIYHDLRPFWALEPVRLRQQSATQNNIRIRNGKIEWRHDFNWCHNTADMIKKFVNWLPDLDFVMNLLDEPRVVVPWEQMKNYTAIELEKRAEYGKLEVKDIVRHFSNNIVGHVRPDVDKFEHLANGWETFNGDSNRSNWPFLVAGCSPDSPARIAFEKNKAYRSWNAKDIPGNPIAVVTIEAQSKRLGLKSGFVTNFTNSVDLCQQPELEFLHGAIVNPLSTSHRNDLIPMFGGSKMSVHNEITMPAPIHYAKSDLFEIIDSRPKPEDDGTWGNMYDQVIWRGTKSGGDVNFRNWKTFHRHRFLAMSNPDQLLQYDNGEAPLNWALFNQSFEAAPSGFLALSYAAQEQRMSVTFADRLLTAFTESPCTPGALDPATGECPMQNLMRVGNRLSLHQQFEHKYLPDIDGNSYSGRFRAFVQSNSVPIKATIFREWLDLRLVPWLHFVPMSNTYHDFYPIMEYFLGYREKVANHDQEARWIAKNGRKWAEKVLRREDQEVYMFRLLLEYARVLEDERDSMGWIDDLL